jgi:hypothetical protein
LALASEYGAITLEFIVTGHRNGRRPDATDQGIHPAERLFHHLVRDFGAEATLRSALAAEHL